MLSGNLFHSDGFSHNKHGFVYFVFRGDHRSKIPNFNIFMSLKFYFILANDEHERLHYLPNDLFTGYQWQI